MQIQINTDKNVAGREAFSDQVKDVHEHVLKRFSEHVTRVEVHISDENSDKSGINDKHCLMQARLEGRQPITVTHQAEDAELAATGAAKKLKRMIESTLGRWLIINHLHDGGENAGSL